MATPPRTSSGASAGAPAQRLILPARDARSVLLVRCVEEADERGLLLASGERDQATRLARLAGAEASDDLQDPAHTSAYLVRRARALVDTLRTRAPLDVESVVQGRIEARVDPHPAWVLVPALILGLMTNALGPERQVNVLANPLLALLAWNLVILVWRVLALLRPRRPRQARDLPATPHTGWLSEHALDLAFRRLRTERTRETSLGSVAMARYLGAWRRPAAPFLLARLEGHLHLAAAGLIAGAVAGMYQRGVVRLYRATWESTFLSPAAADELLSWLLLPARLFGLELPSVASLAPAGAGGDAAPWIHAWALTATLLVLLPRIALAVLARRRARRRERAVVLEIGEPYFRRLLAPLRGERLEAVVVPYSYHPPARRLDALRALLHDVFGVRAEVSVRPTLEYGAEAEELTAEVEHGPARERCLVLLFNLAQSPELEVHGGLAARLVASTRGSDRLLALVDGAGYTERLHGVPEAETRLAERRRAWDRVLRDAGLTCVHVDLDGLIPEPVVQSVAPAVWQAQEVR